MFFSYAAPVNAYAAPVNARQTRLPLPPRVPSGTYRRERNQLLVSNPGSPSSMGIVFCGNDLVQNGFENHATFSQMTKLKRFQKLCVGTTETSRCTGKMNAFVY